MRGYYHISTSSTGKRRGNARNIKISKFIFDGLDETKFQNIDFTNIKVGFRIAHSLKTCAIKEILMLEFPVSWSSLTAIVDGFDKMIDKSMIWNTWEYVTLEHVQQAVNLLSDEEFILIFQSILESLPPRTISKKNKLKMLDQISANLL